MAAPASSCGGRAWCWSRISCEAEGGTALLTFEQIKELIELVARHQLHGVEVERSGFRLKIEGLQPVAAAAALAAAAMSAGGAGAPGDRSAATGQSPPPAAPLSGLPVHAGEAGTAEGAGTAHLGSLAPQEGPPAPGGSGRPAPQAGLHYLNSPIVGTFYRGPSPDARPFTEVGARVRKGEVLCIIEAMKLMNEIESDADGVVAKIFPQNAQAVEFGEPLFAIDGSG
jgi:acetyl-CoA carboxylase biotin carboxyl carrier protein